jgi:HD-GYP domain-containing protein (c-di-GMP phosphodiesterase class II)
MAFADGRGQAGEPVRLADLLTGLTLVSDLAMARQPGDSLRSALVATRFARELELPDPVVADVFYTALLEHVGCTAQAHETAALLGGDELAVNAAGVRTNFADTRDVFTTFLPELTRGADPLRRIRLITATLVRGNQVGRLHQANCEVAATMADRLGLGQGVQDALMQEFEGWNGKGVQGRRGDDIALPVRVTHVASVAVLFHGLGGPDAAIDAVRRWSGGTLDPALVDVFVVSGAELLDEALSGDAAEALLAVEPEPVRTLSRAGLLEAARAFGEMVELKSPYLHGHAAAVTELATTAGTSLGLDEADDDRLTLAGLLHDVGRVSVPSGVWDKPGRLTAAEWEQVRLHPYHTERILQRTPILAPVAAIAGMHHERCDGSGYHRGATAVQMSMAARVLAAADMFAGLVAERPHRKAHSPSDAAKLITDAARAGRLDREAAGAVAEAAGERRRPKRVEWPAGLTDRQVEVLRLLARGCSNREIARRLVVSTRTAEHHVQDIYLKIGVSGRASAAMFAMRNALLE